MKVLTRPLLAVVVALSGLAVVSIPAGGAGGPRLVATLVTGRRPEPVLADPAHHRVYVGNESGATVTVIDDRTNRIVKVIPAAHEIEDLALDAASRMLYTANRKSQNVTVINTGSLTAAASISPGGNPNGVALDPARHRLYVTLTAQGLVAVVDTRTRKVVRTVAAPGDPQGIGVDMRTHRVFVALEQTSRLLVFDPAGWRLLASIRVSTHPVHPVRVDSVRHRVFVVGSIGSQLYVIDGRRLTINATIPTGANPEGVDFSPDGRFAYVSNEGDPGTDKNSGTTVSVIDLAGRRTIDTIQVLQGPDGIAYDPASSSLYVNDETPYKISVVALPVAER